MEPKESKSKTSRFDDFKHSPISKLPKECLIRIFSYLPIADRVRIQKVCKHWRHASLMSWSSLKTLTMDLEDWGFDYDQDFKIDQIILKKVLQLCGPYITRIDFSNYFKSDSLQLTATKSFFEILLKLCPNLTAINIVGLNTTPQCIEYLGKTQSNLIEFKTSFCENVEKPLEILFKNNRNLRNLQVMTPWINGHCWLNLNPVAVKEIEFMGGCDGVDGFRTALGRFTNLRRFKMLNSRSNAFGTHINELLNTIASSAKNFEELDITNSVHAVDLQFDNPKRFSNLRKLILNGRTMNVSDEFTKTIAKYSTRLTCVKLGSVNVTDSQIENILKLPKLEELHLSRLEQVTDAIFLNDLPSLKILYCNGCPGLKNFGFSEFLRKSAKNLQELNIEGCKKINLNSLVQNAKEATDSRVTGPLLKMFVKGTSRGYLDNTKVIKLSQYFELRSQYF